MLFFPELPVMMPVAFVLNGFAPSCFFHYTSPNGRIYGRTENSVERCCHSFGYGGDLGIVFCFPKCRGRGGGAVYVHGGAYAVGRYFSASFCRAEGQDC